MLRRALAWLSVNKVGVMIFPTGNCISSFATRYSTDITVLMRAHGQYVGNHSISHPRLTRLSYASVARQLGSPGVVTNYGRPPYGAVSPTVDRVYAASRAPAKSQLTARRITTRSQRCRSSADTARPVIIKGSLHP